jgi:hypothetical protein
MRKGLGWSLHRTLFVRFYCRTRLRRTFSDIVPVKKLVPRMSLARNRRSSDNGSAQLRYPGEGTSPSSSNCGQRAVAAAPNPEITRTKESRLRVPMSDALYREYPDPRPFGFPSHKYAARFMGLVTRLNCQEDFAKWRARHRDTCDNTFVITVG